MAPSGERGRTGRTGRRGGGRGGEGARAAGQAEWWKKGGREGAREQGRVREEERVWSVLRVVARAWKQHSVCVDSKY